MDQDIRPIKVKPRLRAVRASNGGCNGCDLLGKPKLCKGQGPGMACVPKDLSPLLHFKIVGEHPSTR